VIFLPIAVLFFISSNIDRLTSKKFKVKFGSLYSDFKIYDIKARSFISIFLFRRLILALTIIFLSEYPCF